jgi:Secretion system C-terminal sorting domain/Fibronectin type III domain/Sortilin, neurotensin receptor 3,
MKTFYSSRTIRSLLTMILLLLSDLLFAQGQGRVNIFELMERRDLRLSEIDAIARKHFDVVGRERGTGHKQYERWKFEMQFHLDEKGYLLPAGYDAQQYQAAASSMEAPAQAGAWTESGPTSWNRTSGWNPGVGRITAIAVSPSDTSIIYITTPGGGIWKSSQGGNQWVPLADYNNAMMNMFSVAVDPSNPDIVLAGNTSGTVYKSTDGGYTWTSRNGNAGNTKKIIFHPTDQQILYAVGTSGISKSIDGGNTFVRKFSGGVEDIEFQPGNPAIMIASGNSIFRSSDGGETWATLGAANGVNFSARTLVSVSPNNPQVVYAVQANGSEFGRMLRSVDGGNTFITTVTGSATSGTNYFGYETTGTGTGGQASYDMAMTVNPLNANEVHIAGIICWKSTNGGTSFVAETAWSLPNSIGYNHADVHVLEWVGKTIYSGSDGGIYKSTDLGDNWTDLTRGLGIRQFYRIAVAKTDAITLTGGAQDNGSSVMRTTGWVDWLGADGMDCLVSPLDAKIIFGTSQYGSLYRTIDGGNSRTNLSKPENGAWVTPLAIESNSNNFYAGFVGVYKYTNNGASYTKISGSVITSLVTSLAVAPSNSNYIYASTGTVLYVTKDGGATWTSYTAPASINSFDVHPTDPEKVWITCNSTTNRVLVSTNAGVSFTNISGNLPAVAARSVKVDDTPNEGIYAALNIGVYYTNKNMTGWINLTDNLPQVAINEIEIHKTAGKIRIGTYGRGAWERALYTACSAPVSLTATNITTSEATVNWAADAAATGYNVEYKTTASSTWNTAIANTQQTSYTITGLAQGTSYDWRVNIICSSGTSDYAASAFTITTQCPDPANLQAANLTTNAATLSWSAAAGATSYTLEYKTSASQTWTNISSSLTATSYELSGLAEGTTYDWRVQATCTAGNGNFATAQFATRITCNAPVNLQATNIASTSATLSWAAVSGATGYDVETKLSSSGTWTVRAAGITSTNYNLAGLTASSVYDWRVRTNCGTLGGYSTYAQSQLTTTAAPCTDNYESNNTNKQAKSIGYPSSITASIGSGTDVDWFKFTTTTSATKIRITLSNLPANYDVYLYDKGLRELGRSVQTGTTSELVIYNGTATRATYYIKVQGANSSSFSASSCYSLMLESSSVNFTPSFNDVTQSNIISPQVMEETSKWKMYPNPARGLVNINFSSSERTKGQLQIIDMSGKILQNKTVDIIAGSNFYSLDLKQYVRGIYMIRLSTGKKSFTNKLLIE